MSNKTIKPWLSIFSRVNWFLAWVTSNTGIIIFYIFLVHIGLYIILSTSNDFSIVSAFLGTILTGWLFCILSSPLIFPLYILLSIMHIISEKALNHIERRQNIHFTRYQKKYNPVPATEESTTIKDKDNRQLIKGILIGIGMAYIFGIGS